MSTGAIITICIILLALVLFITELISIDLVGLLVMSALILTGVISPKEGVEGFSNSATITVVFMFVLSAALLKTGALQLASYRLAAVFKKSYLWGFVLLMTIIGCISAFINNTPIVAVFIPVGIQIAKDTGINPRKLLIPISFATILGGTVTLVGTSTNFVVSGIAEKAGLPAFTMFDQTGPGLIFLSAGVLYLGFFSKRFLPDIKDEADLEKKFGVRDYVCEIELTENSKSIDKTIMESDLIKEFELDIIEIRRNGQTFTLPAGDFVLKANDILKVVADTVKIKNLKDKAKILVVPAIKIANNDLKGKNSTLVELIITSNSDIEGLTLKEIDFRRKFRGIPLAIKHRDEIIHEHLYNVKLKAGDIILAEIKTHFVKEIKKMESEVDASFIMVSEDNIIDFNRKNFYLVTSLTLAIIILAACDIIDIMVGAIVGVSLLALLKIITMKEMYESISWNVIFLLASALCMSTAMQNTKLDNFFADFLINSLGAYGPLVICSALYLFTTLLTEIMSNNATAALIAPIAIALAEKLEVSAMPFLMTITFAASASFMTPIGYQTNMMVYNAGNYKFIDFVKFGLGLDLILWVIATFAIPFFFPF